MFFLCKSPTIIFYTTSIFWWHFITKWCILFNICVVLVLLCFYILYKLKSWCPICCKKSYVNLVSCHILVPTIKCSFTNTLITFIYLKLCGTLYWIFHIPLFHYSIIFHIPFLRFHIVSHYQVQFYQNFINLYHL